MIKEGTTTYLFVQFTRFCFVGTLGLSLNYGIFFFCLEFLEFHYLISGGFGYTLAILPVFLINRHYTFESNVSLKRGLPLYVTINLTNLGCHVLVQWFAVSILGVTEMISQVFGIFVTTLLNFTMLKSFVFHPKK